MSEKKKTIYEKLFDLQSEVGAIAKDSKNPFYKSRYFDVNGLLAHIQPLLKKNRLLLTQPILDNCVISEIMDIDTGNTVKSKMELPTINDPQKMGSAITYFRRYTLQSLLALQAEDDDGNSASVESKKKPSLNPDSDRWIKAVHSMAKGEVDISKVKKLYDISKEDAERLVTESMEVANEQ